MSETEADIAYDAYNNLCVGITNLVRNNIAGMTADQKQLVIDLLHDNFRFWNAIEGKS